jgi:anti-sigma B factor antagonist
MEIRERNVESVMCLDVQGRLVLCDEEHLLRNRINELLSRGNLQIVLNLKDVSQIDTTGLCALIAVKLAVDRAKGTIKLINLPARVISLLVITRIITLFDVCETEAEALNSFAMTTNV